MDAETQAARDKLKQRFGSAGARIGGKGTVRRKAKAVTKTASSDDKKLVSTLKRLGVNTIPGIEEVSIFKDDGSAIVFSGPKVQASIGSNTYVITGTAENKTAAEMLPSMMSSMAGLGGAGGINAAQLKMLQEALAKGGAGLGSIPGLSGLASALGAAGAEGGADEDVPELEGDFESASEK